MANIMKTQNATAMPIPTTPATPTLSCRELPSFTEATPRLVVAEAACVGLAPAPSPDSEPALLEYDVEGLDVLLALAPLDRVRVADRLVEAPRLTEGDLEAELPLDMERVADGEILIDAGMMGSSVPVPSSVSGTSLGDALCEPAKFLLLVGVRVFETLAAVADGSIVCATEVSTVGFVEDVLLLDFDADACLDELGALDFDAMLDMLGF